MGQHCPHLPAGRGDAAGDRTGCGLGGRAACDALGNRRTKHHDNKTESEQQILERDIDDTFRNHLKIPAGRKHHLRALTSMFGREFADQVRDELEFL